MDIFLLHYSIVQQVTIEAKRSKRRWWLILLAAEVVGLTVGAIILKLEKDKERWRRMR